MLKTILKNGVEMPLVGFGTYQITDEKECEETVINAIQVGYRLIDTAQAYGNEVAVGRGIKASGIPREQLFVTTKLNFKSYETADAETALTESFEKLDLDYLDLVILHWPFGNVYAAYRVLEKWYEAGKIRAIGVSNFSGSQLIDLNHFNRVTPAVNQIETNLYAQQQELHEIMERYRVIHQGYAPFGQGRLNEMFSEAALVEIAEKYQKSPRQIAARFFIQQGISIIPKSTHIERMKENIDLFDFQLTENEMEIVKKLDHNQPLIGNPLSPALTESAMTW